MPDQPDHPCRYAREIGSMETSIKDMKETISCLPEKLANIAEGISDLNIEQRDNEHNIKMAAGTLGTRVDNAETQASLLKAEVKKIQDLRPAIEKHLEAAKESRVFLTKIWDCVLLTAIAALVGGVVGGAVAAYIIPLLK